MLRSDHVSWSVSHGTAGELNLVTLRQSLDPKGILA